MSLRMLFHRYSAIPEAPQRGRHRAPRESQWVRVVAGLRTVPGWAEPAMRTLPWPALRARTPVGGTAETPASPEPDLAP